MGKNDDEKNALFKKCEEARRKASQKDSKKITDISETLAWQNFIESFFDTSKVAVRVRVVSATEYLERTKND